MIYGGAAFWYDGRSIRGLRRGGGQPPGAKSSGSKTPPQSGLSRGVRQETGDNRIDRDRVLNGQDGIGESAKVAAGGSGTVADAVNPPGGPRLETILVHAGGGPVQANPTALPIYPSNSYIVDSLEELDGIMSGKTAGYSYARHGNPTVDGLAEAMARLEGAETVIATASGMAAIDAAFFAVGLGPGDTVLLSRDLYGASLHLARSVWGQYGVRTATLDMSDLEGLRSALDEFGPKALLFETLSNPLLKVADLPRVVEMAHGAGCQVIVDNTFATPLAMQPLRHGADLVVHSATKYIGGHGDAMGGIVAAGGKYSEVLHQFLKSRGAVLGPFEGWLLHRGLRTLSVRFERQCETAWHLARDLERTGRLRAVYHPFLQSHPTVDVARKLLPEKLGGAVVTLELPGGKEGAFRFVRALRVVRPATTVGDVYSLCLYPPVASHRNQTLEERLEMGITDGTMRIAVGLEHRDDLFADLLQAVEAAERG